jgi:hypothetical protein
MDEVLLKLRELSTLLEEAHDLQDWSFIEESLEEIELIYDLVERHSSNFDDFHAEE